MSPHPLHSVHFSSILFLSSCPQSPLPCPGHYAFPVRVGWILLEKFLVRPLPPSPPLPLQTGQSLLRRGAEVYSDFCAGSGVSKLASGQPEPPGLWGCLASPDLFSKPPAQPGSAPLQPLPLHLGCFLPLPWPLLPKRAIDSSTLGLDSPSSLSASGLIPSSPSFSPPFLPLSLLLMQNPGLAPNAEMELSTRI